MIRGVSFEISQTTTDTLWKILSCINIENFCWFNIEDQNETWSDVKGSAFFDSNYYDGMIFKKHIQSKHYIVFLKLQAFLQGEKFSNVHTYEEFLFSNCKILLLVNDCRFVEIYCKDEFVSKSIYENALLNNFTNIEYITETNDTRTKMDVL